MLSPDETRESMKLTFTFAFNVALSDLCYNTYPVNGQYPQFDNSYYNKYSDPFPLDPQYRATHQSSASHLGFFSYDSRSCTLCHCFYSRRRSPSTFTSCRTHSTSRQNLKSTSVREWSSQLPSLQICELVKRPVTSAFSPLSTPKSRSAS
jgi:hypothetical protein